MGPQLKAQSIGMLYSTWYSTAWKQGRSRRLKWCAYTDIKCLGNDQGDKLSRKCTQCLSREEQEQGFPVKGTGEYGVKGNIHKLCCVLT